MDFFKSKYDVLILFKLVISIGLIFSYGPLLGKIPMNSSFHGNHSLGIYGKNSRAKCSIDLPNGYVSEQNGMF